MLFKYDENIEIKQARNHVYNYDKIVDWKTNQQINWPLIKIIEFAIWMYVIDCAHSAWIAGLSWCNKR